MSKIVTVENTKFLIDDDGRAYPVAVNGATAAPAPKKLTIQDAIAIGVRDHGRVDRDILCAEVAKKLEITAEQVSANLYHVINKGYISIYPTRSKGPQDLSWNGKPFDTTSSKNKGESSDRTAYQRHVRTVQFKEFMAARLTHTDQPFEPLLAAYNLADNRAGRNQCNVSHFRRLGDDLTVIIDKEAKTIRLA